MKILQVTDAYYPYPSGLSESVHHLSQKLRSFGHHVDIVATSFGSREDEKYEAMRVGRVIYIPLNKSYATMPFGFDVPAKMKWIVRDGDYDVIHSHGPVFPNLSYFALKYSNTKNLATFHTSSEKAKGFGSGIFKMIFGRVNDKLDVRVAVSENAKTINQIYIPGYYHVISQGVDIDRFNPKGKKLKDMMEDSVLFVGRLDQRKGLHRLLKAFVHVKEKVQNANLFVVGGGPLRNKYLKMAKEYAIEKSVHFLGYVSNEMLPTYYRSTTVYTSPAEGRESFGIVLVEAMASGTAVIASDIAGYDKVIDNGRNGLLVDTDNPNEYGRALIEVLENSRLRKNLVDGGLRDVSTKYSWDIIARRYERLY